MPHDPSSEHPSDQTSEHRLTELEIRLTHQSELLEQLDGVIYEQSKKIDALEKKLNTFEKQVSDPTIPTNDKPPHY